MLMIEFENSHSSVTAIDDRKIQSSESELPSLPRVIARSLVTGNSPSVGSNYTVQSIRRFAEVPRQGPPTDDTIAPALGSAFSGIHTLHARARARAPVDLSADAFDREFLLDIHTRTLMDNVFYCYFFSFYYSTGDSSCIQMFTNYCQEISDNN